MKRQLVKLLTHALFFLIAVLVGIYGLFQVGIDGVLSNTAKGDVLFFVAVYLGLVAIEAIVEERFLAKRSIGHAVMSLSLALAAGTVAFILFLFIGYSIGEVTPNRLLSGLVAVLLFLAIEWPIRFGLERATRRLRT